LRPLHIVTAAIASDTCTTNCHAAGANPPTLTITVPSSVQAGSTTEVTLVGRACADWHVGSSGGVGVLCAARMRRRRC
jgi:hypothetical protein